MVPSAASSSLTTGMRNNLLQFGQVPAEECVDIGEVDANFAGGGGFQP